MGEMEYVINIERNGTDSELYINDVYVSKDSHYIIKSDTETMSISAGIFKCESYSIDDKERNKIYVTNLHYGGK
jgi:hypothetical protein